MASEVRKEDGSLPRLPPRMPVVKMEMEPQKVALEEEDLRFSRFFLWGDYFLGGAFFLDIEKNIWM